MPIFVLKKIWLAAITAQIAAIFNSIWRANEEGAKDAISFFDTFTAPEAKSNPFNCAQPTYPSSKSIQFNFRFQF